METYSESASTQVIDDFMLHYPLQRLFFKKAAKSVMRDCQRAIRSADPLIRASFSYRAKTTTSLRKKLLRIQEKEKIPWKNAQDIWKRISDMAGVRIALYFSGQSQAVQDALARMIAADERVIKHEKAHVESNRQGTTEKSQVPGDRENKESYERRFPGYDGIHYRLRIATLSIDGETDDDNDSNNAGKRPERDFGLEIQLNSASMNIWAEVEHDIVYKQEHGTPSMHESRILDGFDGIMRAVEIFLEPLEKALTNRINAPREPFPDMIDLMGYLKSHGVFIDGGRSERHFQATLNLLRKFGQDSREKVDPLLEELKFKQPSNEIRQQIDDRFKPFKLQPSIYIMARILHSKQAEFDLAWKQEGLRARGDHGVEENYRCNALINCLLWLIADLFEPVLEVQILFEELTDQLSNPQCRALGWAIDGVRRHDIRHGTIEPNMKEKDYINTLWNYLESCDKPVVKFVFDISRLGLQAPGDLSKIGNQKMYRDFVVLLNSRNVGSISAI